MLPVYSYWTWEFGSKLGNGIDTDMKIIPSNSAA
jgi:hypothetical protein